MAGSEADHSTEEAPRLAIFSLPGITVRSGVGYEGMMGISTPPHHAASIPFRWEEEPGKPRPCKALSLPSATDSNRGLELPPRLLKFTKTPSPTTVLEGPYAGRSVFHSLRIIRNEEAASSDALLGSMVLAKRNKEKGSFVFSTSRKRSFLGLTKARSNFWATIYGAVKQVIASPRRRKHN